jgi:hypothetical protein
VLASVYISFDDKSLSRNVAVQWLPCSRSCESYIRYLYRITESLKSNRVCSLSDMVLFVGSETADAGGRIVSGVSLRPLPCLLQVGIPPGLECLYRVLCVSTIKGSRQI